MIRRTSHTVSRGAVSAPAFLVASLIAIAALSVAPSTANARYEEEAIDSSVDALYQSYYAWAADGAGMGASYHYYSYLYTYYGYYYAAWGYYDGRYQPFELASTYFSYGGQLADSLLIYYDAGNTTYVARSKIALAGGYCYQVFAWGPYEDDIDDVRKRDD